MKYILTFLCLGVSALSLGQKIDTAKLNSYLSAFEKSNAGIGSVSIFKDGQSVYNRDFGQKHFKNLTYNSSTRFYVGSTTKTFTATLILQLVEKGKLSVDDKLTAFYPDIPNSEKITLGNLLSHTSGLGDYVTKNDSLRYWLREPQSEKTIMNEIKRQGVLFQPGDSVSYSNSGYYLLSKILEKKYDEPYGKILKTQIIDKLHLKSIGIASAKPKNTFKSLEFKNGAWKPLEEFYFPNATGVGNIVATMPDLNRFVEALFKGELISQKSLDYMIPEKGKTFGHGLMLVPFYSHKGYGHGGDTFGTHSAVGYFPESDISVAYAVNGERYAHNDLAIALLRIIFQDKLDIPNFKFILSLSKKNLESYTGVYSSPDYPLKLTVTLDDNKLYAQATGQSEFPLSPVKKNKFSFSPAGITITFRPKKESLTIDQQGSKNTLKKE